MNARAWAWLSGSELPGIGQHFKTVIVVLGTTIPGLLSWAFREEGRRGWSAVACPRAGHDGGRKSESRFQAYNGKADAQTLCRIEPSPKPDSRDAWAGMTFILLILRLKNKLTELKLKYISPMNQTHHLTRRRRDMGPRSIDGGHPGVLQEGMVALRDYPAADHQDILAPDPPQGLDQGRN